MPKLKLFREVHLLRSRGLSGPFMAPYGKNKLIHTPGNHLATGGGEDLAVFEALAPDANGVMQLQTKGQGTPTFTRASNQYSLGADGIYYEFGVNEPAWAGGTVTGAVGSREVRGANAYYDAPPQAQNLALYSNDLTNAVWVKTGCTATRDQGGIDGSANTGTRLTATGANATALQTVTLASASHTARFWIKRITGTGQVEVTVDGGTTWTPVTPTADYAEFLVNATVANPQIGVRIVTSGDEVAVGQGELYAGTVAQIQGSGPIFTAGAAVTRFAPTLSYDPANFSDHLQGFSCRFKTVSYADLDGTYWLNFIWFQGANRMPATIIASGPRGMFDGTTVVQLDNVGAWTTPFSAAILSTAWSATDSQMAPRLVAENGEFDFVDNPYDGSFTESGTDRMSINNNPYTRTVQLRDLALYDGVDYEAIKNYLRTLTP